MKTKKKKELKIILEFRLYTQGTPDVWLIKQDGAAESSLMHGEMNAPLLREFALFMKKKGFPVRGGRVPIVVPMKERKALPPANPFQQGDV